MRPSSKIYEVSEKNLIVRARKIAKATFYVEPSPPLSAEDAEVVCGALLATLELLEQRQKSRG